MMDESSSDDCDVVVIGGGLSGLVAARTLIQHDNSLRVTLLEASHRLGGRVESIKCPKGSKGKKFDLGAHWVATTQPRIMSLLEDFNLKTHSQFLQGKKLMQTGGSKIRTYTSVLPNVGSWLALLELGWVLYKLEKLASRIQLHDPITSTGGWELDAITVHSWIKTNTHYLAVREVLLAAMRTTFGVDSSQMSMLYFLTVSKSAGGVEVLFESSEGGAQEFTVKEGTGAIVEKIADDIKNDVNILLNQAVNTVEQNEDGSTCVMTMVGRIFRCRRLIVCIPPPQQCKIIWSPELPNTKRFALQSQQMAAMIKFFAIYPKPYWREKGYSGELVSSGTDGSPITITFDDSDEQEFALVGFIGGRLAVEWAGRSEKQLEDAILEHLAECFGSWAYETRSIIIKNWSNEPFIAGAPTCNPNLGTMHSYRVLRDPTGNIHFGGTETATVWIGYMEGAVQSGTRTALEVLQHLKPQSLSSPELMELQRFSARPQVSAGRKHRDPVSRWALLLPLVCVTGIAVAFNLRDKWAHCFIPFR